MKKVNEKLVLKTTINNNWKTSVFSLSGLVRYAKGEGANDLQSLLNAINKDKGTKVTLGQVANVKNIVAHATERELFKKDGTKKDKFSFWLLILTAGRIAKAEILSAPSDTGKPVKKVSRKAKAAAVTA
jgi:hypothetical protein